MMIAVEFKGVKYRSINAMLRAIGISKGTYKQRKAQGIPLDMPKFLAQKRRVYADNMVFDSVKDYCEYAGIKRSGYKYRRAKNFKVKPYRRPVEYNGVKYPSINALAHALGLSRGKARELLGL